MARSILANRVPCGVFDICVVMAKNAHYVIFLSTRFNFLLVLSFIFSCSTNIIIMSARVSKKRTAVLRQRVKEMAKRDGKVTSRLKDPVLRRSWIIRWNCQPQLMMFLVKTRVMKTMTIRLQAKIPLPSTGIGSGR